MTTKKSVISAVIKSENEIQNGLSPSDLLDCLLDILPNIHDSLLACALYILRKLLNYPGQLGRQNGDIFVCFANDTLHLAN
jgi:hypothetical protein